MTAYYRIGPKYQGSRFKVFIMLQELLEALNGFINRINKKGCIINAKKFKKLSGFVRRLVISLPFIKRLLITIRICE